MNPPIPAAACIRGGGWFSSGGWGCVLHAKDGLRGDAAPGVVPAALADRFSPPRNWGRYSPAVQAAYFAAALARLDAGAATDAGERFVGIAATGPGVLLEDNLSYFRDYVEAGRTLGRGALFIYTLPTSAAAEIAIAMGLRGPLLHIREAGPGWAPALETAGDLLGKGDADAMIVLHADRDGAGALWLDRTGPPGPPAAALRTTADALDSAGGGLRNALAGLGGGR